MYIARERKIVLSLISGGKWEESHGVLNFKGKQTTSALMISHNLPLGLVKRKIIEKLKIVACSDDVYISYKSPNYPNLPPYNVYDQEDYDTFGYLNTGMCEGDVWPIPLHISCYNEAEVFEEKPILNHKPGEEVMDVRLSAPEYVSQIDATCSRSRMD